MTVSFVDLSKAYGTNTVISHLSGALYEGVHYIEALNGSGKTTLLELIVGIAKPTWGAIHWKGVPIFDGLRKGGVSAAYCPANPDFYEGVSVRDAVRMFRYMHGLSVSRDPFVHADPFGLSRYRDSLFGELSFGWRKRVLLHMAFSVSPDILALDEPFSGLDSEALSVLYAMLSERSRKGVTVVVTHDAPSQLSPGDSNHKMVSEGAGANRRTFLHRLDHGVDGSPIVATRVEGLRPSLPGGSPRG